MKFTGLLILLAVFAGCTPPAPKPNQVQPMRSPSGKYVLTLPIERNPAYHDALVWKVTISDANGHPLYKDDASEFVGNLNVYWMWDDADRVWIYNSDDGGVWFWELDGTQWIKTFWGYGASDREIDRVIEQPPALYPYQE